MVEAVTTTTALVAVGAAVATLALVSIVLLRRRRRSGGGEQQQMLALVSEMNTRMESMVRELSESLERAQEEGRRNRYLTELAGSIDLDEVLSRTLEAGGAVPGVDAALVSISSDDEKPLVATLGLSTEEAERQGITRPPDSHEARAVSLVYQYPPGRAARRRRSARGARRAGARCGPLRRRRLPRRRRRVRGHPARVDDRGCRPALPPAPGRRLLASRRAGRAPVDLGRHGGDPRGRQSDRVLRARRRGTVPSERARQGPGRLTRGPARDSRAAGRAPV